MPIEVELKARVPHRDRLLLALDQRAKGEPSVYRDTYYDTPDDALAEAGKELRVRVVELTDGTSGRRVVLTFKSPPLDATSQPEQETTVANANAIAAILDGIGYVPALAYEKHCINYTLTHRGRATTVTFVQVPELGGETFVEIETLVEHASETAAATEVIQAVLVELLSLDETAVTDELYTDAVRRHRAAT